MRSPRSKLLLFILAVALYRLLTLGLTPLSPDEAYYLAWSKRLDVCYYDQPGMIAWVAALFNFYKPEPTVFSYRLPTVFLSALTTFLACLTYREYSEDENESALFAALFSIMPFSWLAGMMMIHDSVLTPWLVLICLALVRLAKHDGRPADWLLFVLALAGGFYSKFSAGMLGWGLALYMLWSLRGRGWFKTWPPYVFFALLCLLLSPVFYWNYQHDWITLQAMDELVRTKGVEFKDRVGFVFEYIGSQVGFFSPLIGITVFAALFIGLKRLRRRELDEVSSMLVCLPLPIFLYFLMTSMRARVYGNWPAVAFLPLAMLGMREAAAAIKSGREKGIFGRQWIITGLAINIGMIVIFSLYFQFRLFDGLFDYIEEKFNLENRIDFRYDRDYRGWEKMAEVVREHKDQADFLLARNYQTASMLDFYLSDILPVEVYTERRRDCQYNIWSELKGRVGQDAFYVSDKKIPGVIKKRFKSVEFLVDPFPIGRPERPAKVWHIYLCKGFKGEK